MAQKGGTLCVHSHASVPPRLAGARSQLGGVTRAGLVLVRLVAAAEVLRLGYLVGSYKQGIDCTQRLVSLRSALGGEVAAIIRERAGRQGVERSGRPRLTRSTSLRNRISSLPPNTPLSASSSDGMAPRSAPACRAG